MNKETERKYESTFIPCGDALEKMDLFEYYAADKLPDGKSADETAESD